MRNTFLNNTIILIAMVVGAVAAYYGCDAVGWAITPMSWDFAAAPLGGLAIFFGSVIAGRLFVAALDSGAGGNTGALGLWLGGLGWRLAARLVQVSIFVVPAVALYWSFLR